MSAGPQHIPLSAEVRASMAKLLQDGNYTITWAQLESLLSLLVLSDVDQQTVQQRFSKALDHARRAGRANPVVCNRWTSKPSPFSSGWNCCPRPLVAAGRGRARCVSCSTRHDHPDPIWTCCGSIISRRMRYRPRFSDVDRVHPVPTLKTILCQSKGRHGGAAPLTDPEFTQLLELLQIDHSSGSLDRGQGTAGQLCTCVAQPLRPSSVQKNKMDSGSQTEAAVQRFVAAVVQAICRPVEGPDPGPDSTTSWSASSLLRYSSGSSSSSSSDGGQSNRSCGSGSD